MSDEMKWQYDLEEYIRQGEPGKVEKSEAWQTAIGLQAVDGLKTSKYLLDTAKEPRVISPLTRLKSVFRAITSNVKCVPKWKTQPRRQILFPHETQNF